MLKSLPGLLFIALTAQLLYAVHPATAQLPAFSPGEALITGGLPVETNPVQHNTEPQGEQTINGTPSVVVPDPAADAKKAKKAAKSINDSSPEAVQPLEEITNEVSELSDAIGSLEESVKSRPRDDQFLARSRVEIQAIEKAADEKIAQLKPRLTDIERQIAKLGEKPKDGEAKESEQASAERERLERAQATIKGAIKTAQVLNERASQLGSQVLELRQRIFTDTVFERGPSPLSPALWTAVLSEIPAGGRQLTTIFENWTKVLLKHWQRALIILLSSLVAFEVMRRTMVWARRAGLMNGKDSEGAPPTFFQRATAASWVTASFMMPGLLATAAFVYSLEYFGLFSVEMRRLAYDVLLAVATILAVWGLSRAILQPRRPAWRLFQIDGESSQRLVRIVSWMAIVYGADLVLQDIMASLLMPPPVRTLEAALATLAFAGLLFAFVRTPLAKSELSVVEPAQQIVAETQPSKMAPWWLKFPALFIAIGLAIAALLGYVALGRFVAGQVIVAGCLIVAALLLALAIRALTTQQTSDGDPPMQQALRRHFELDEAPARLLTRTTSIALQVLLPFVALPILFVSWGYSVDDALAWLKSLLFGFKVGGFEISLVQLGLAAGLFVAILFVTRLAQRSLTRRVVQPGRLQNGVANSIQTAIGYVGFAIAALAAVSFAGFDITNLAIVAGALSIGIGFGLQSIVNNFVSGLIILFERPIKVGDWVSVGNFDGFVRRISVRSTEIETFDRTNVIVPNAEFISNPIVNLTHRSALGRIVVPVGVSYSSDPEFVRDLLLKTTQDTPRILEDPSPSVQFEDFGSSSLDFVIRAYIADINTKLGVATDLRLRVFKALADAGIEIPFPQQDVHMRDLDPVRSALQRIALERATKAEESGAGDNN